LNTSRTFTLLILDHCALLLDGTNTLLATLPSFYALGAREAGPDLRALLPPKSQLQLILAGPGVAIQCTDVPFLSAKERKEVHLRLSKAAGDPGTLHAAHAVDVDPLAEGGHVLWSASQPRDDLDPWLTLLQRAGATPVFITPWQRALLAAAQQVHPSALYLTLETGLARVIFARGHNLRFTRTFPLPKDLDPLHLNDANAGELRQMIEEELSLLLQFIQQKHRGVAPSALFTVGLPASPIPILAPVARNLGLALTNLATDLPAFLIEGANRERQRKARLDLLPEEIRKARSLATYRILVRAGAAAMVLICGGTAALVRHHVQVLEQEAVKAENGLEQRQLMAKQGEEASRLRFALLRVRQGEQRQRQATEHLERLGVRLLQPPPGVVLSRVEITQASGTGLAQAFKVEGAARTRREFSVGALVTYLDRLAAEPGLKLEPLQEFSVADSPAGTSLGMPEQAQTTFKLGGTAP
jgi:hypothetical protein